MIMENIPQVKCGIISVSRDCFIISLSENRRNAIVKAYEKDFGSIYEVQKTVENETDMLAAVAEAKKAGCNALVVFLGNFGPETPETLIAQQFDGPVMYVAAAEETGKNLINGRGDAYCGMLNCSYNLGLRKIKAFIPEYPVGTADELAQMIAEFQPIARTLLGISQLKIITFGPRPQDFFACNAPIKPLYDLGVEVEENSELDLLVSYRAHKGDARIPAVIADMSKELGKEGNPWPDLLERMAQYELTLLDWAEAHKGSRKYVAFANKCWPAFPTEFGFEPCYVNSRLVSRGIPVACEVDIYGALSEYIGICTSNDTVTLLDINNSVPKDLYEEEIKPSTTYTLQDTFMGFHCGNTPLCKLKKGGVNSESFIGKRQYTGYYTGYIGRRHCCRSNHVLPSPKHSRLSASCLYRTRGSTAGSYTIFRRHWHLCHSGNGPFLPSRFDRKTIPASRSCRIWSFWQSAVLHFPISRRTGYFL